MSNLVDDPGKWRVLIVEDSRELADIVKHLLTAEGAVVQVANTGETAYDLLANFAPTFVLLDLKLPDTDGFTIMNTMRNQHQIHVPIIAFTARAHVEAKELLDDGFDSYILKPFRMEEFVPNLKSILLKLS